MKVTKDIGETFIKNTRICDEIVQFFENTAYPKRITGTKSSIASQKKDTNVRVSEYIPGRKCKDLTVTRTLIETNPEFKLFEPLLEELNRGVKEYEKKVNVMKFPVFLLEGFNLQKYTPPYDVYSILHFEHNLHSELYFRRVYTWTLYLNDVSEGGETFFPKQRVKVTPKKGKLVFFPAYFTHPHKGLKAKTEKYIATGWFSALLKGETAEELIVAHEQLNLLGAPKSYFSKVTQPMFI